MVVQSCLGGLLFLFTFSRRRVCLLKKVLFQLLSVLILFKVGLFSSNSAHRSGWTKKPKFFSKRNVSVVLVCDSHPPYHPQLCLGFCPGDLNKGQLQLANSKNVSKIQKIRLKKKSQRIFVNYTVKSSRKALLAETVF